MIMKRLYHLVVICISFIFCGCSPKIAKQNMSVFNSTPEDFYTFLEQFETINPTDTMMDLSERLTMTDPFHANTIDSEHIQFVAPIPPFFKSSPSVKVKCPKGWYVLLVHQYEVANIELKYIDIISYDSIGNIVNRMNLPYTDEHGGLYYDLDERYASQGEITINKDCLEYTWYYKFDNPKLADTLSFRYKILSDGSMIQATFDKKDGTGVGPKKGGGTRREGKAQMKIRTN